MEESSSAWPLFLAWLVLVLVIYAIDIWREKRRARGRAADARRWGDCDERNRDVLQD